MNQEYMARMSAAELEELAQKYGFTTKAAGSANAKVELIAKRRDRKATITVLGLELSVPIKTVHDKRFTDLWNSRAEGDMEKAMLMLLGEDQYAELNRAVTDEDGTVDLDALGYAYTKIATSKELKNY